MRNDEESSSVTSEVDDDSDSLACESLNFQQDEGFIIRS